MQRSGLASLLVVLASAVSLQTLLYAQASSPGTQQNNPAPAATQQSVLTGAQPVVVASLNGINTTTWSELGRTVTVAVKGLRDWSKTNGNDVRSLRLYLAGHVLPTQPTLISLSEEYVNFALRPNFSEPGDRKTWMDILREARRSDDGSIPIAVGRQDSIQPFESRQYIKLHVYPRYTTFVIIGLAILLLALFYLGWRSDLLRDGTTGRPPAPAEAPFSLGRMQMAWWFYLVIAAFLYIGLVTGQANTVTASVLALIGISAGTGLESVFVDQQKSNALGTQRTALVIEQKALQDRIAELQVGGAPAPGSVNFKVRNLG